MKGTVKWFNDSKGFGFIKPDEGEKDLFVHRSNVQTPNHSIMEGQRVEFQITKGSKGPEAVDVQLAD
jgi:cold shock protein